MTEYRNSQLYVLSFLLIFCIVFSYFNVHSWGLVAQTGRLLLLGMVGLVLFFAFYSITQSGTINSGLYRSVRGLIFVFLLYSLSIVWSEHKLSTFSRSVQILSVIFIFYTFFMLGRKGLGKVLLVYIFWLSSLAIFICIFLWLFAGTDGGFDNPNVVGLWAAVGAGLVLSCNKYSYLKYFPFMMAFFLIILSGSRTALGAFFSGTAVYFLWPMVVKSKFVFWAIFIFVFTISVLTIVFISGMAMDLSGFNQIVRELSGKNLLSGRDIAWPIVIDLIYQKPILGWGGGVNLRDVTDFNFSAHNYYLQTALQVGFVGVTFLFFAVLCIWKEGWVYRRGSATKAAFSLFVTVLMSQNFEVTLIQNNMALSYPMWMLLGLSFGVAQNEIEANKQSRAFTIHKDGAVRDAEFSNT